MNQIQNSDIYQEKEKTLSYIIDFIEVRKSSKIYEKKEIKDSDRI